MADPVQRFEFMKSSTRTQVDMIDGRPFFFIDVAFDESLATTCPDVTIGWSPKGDRFGVFVNGHMVYPMNEHPPTDPDDIIGDQP